MERIKLQAAVRQGRGTSASRQLRADGRIPAVVYGKDRESKALSLVEKETRTVIGKNSLIDLIFDGGQASVVLKEVQREPVSGRPIHLDFQEVDLNQKITITVPLHLEGTPAGISEGGILQQTMREVDLECLPTEMPDFLNVDVSHLKVGESLSVAEISVPENMEILTSGEEVIATIVTPTMPVEEEEEEEEDLEPVVIESAEDAEEEA